MSKQSSVTQIILVVFVINLGIAIGGGLYEASVLVPIWSSDPPESVLAFYQHNVANPSFATNQGGRFWIFVTPLLGLMSIAAIISGLHTTGAHRRWRITAAALVLMLVIFTFVWFVPNVLLLTGDSVTRLSRERIESLTNWWVSLNWVRASLYLVAWIMALCALMVPSGRSISDRTAHDNA